MKVMWKAACAAVLITVTFIEIGCGGTYRPVATPDPVTVGNPSGAETEVVLNSSPGISGVLTGINVSGDTNGGNKQVGNVPTSAAFDFSRSTVFTANTTTDSVTKVLLNSATTGFAANTTTIALETGSAPIGLSFQYFGTTYTQDYVVNSGKTVTCPSGGSLGAIGLTTVQLNATICVGVTPVFAWIYKDQSKVFVLDNSENQVYVVSASKFKTTNKIPVGVGPFKATQSADGSFIYVLNGGDGTVSIVDGQAESVVGSAVHTNPVTASLPIDIAQDVQFNDTTNNLQYNHIWILHADGTVSVFDATTPGTLTWITSIATGANPTNLALMRDGTQAYVGLGGTDKIVAIDAARLANGVITQNATTTITVGVHRSVQETLTNALTPGSPVSKSVPVEVTIPTVSYVAVSRGGNSADLSKAYAATTTSTTYFCYDENVNPTDCTNNDPWVFGTPITSLPQASPYLVPTCTNLVGQNAMTCPNLYNGTAVVTAAGNGATPINTYVTTIPAPMVVTYCNPGNSETGEYDGQKNCPVMAPVLVLGRS